jgi:hypothetical protein
MSASPSSVLAMAYMLAGGIDTPLRLADAEVAELGGPEVAEALGLTRAAGWSYPTGATHRLCIAAMERAGMLGGRARARLGRNASRSLQLPGQEANAGDLRADPLNPGQVPTEARNAFLGHPGPAGDPSPGGLGPPGEAPSLGGGVAHPNNFLRT